MPNIDAVASLAHELKDIETVHHVIKNLISKSQEILKRQELRMLEFEKRLDAVACKQDVHKPVCGE